MVVGFAQKNGSYFFPTKTILLGIFEYVVCTFIKYFFIMPYFAILSLLYMQN